MRRQHERVVFMGRDTSCVGGGWKGSRFSRCKVRILTRGEGVAVRFERSLTILSRHKLVRDALDSRGVVSGATARSRRGC